MATLERGTLFTPKLSKDMFNEVKGKSALAALSNQEGIPFTGTTIFTFSFDNEVALLGESEKKGAGGISIEPVTMTPLKVEYGARVSDEFLYASEEEQIDILTNFADGFAKKVARGIDIMAMHGINPRTKTTSSLIGINSFDTASVETVTYTAASADQNIEEAISIVDDNDYDVTGIAMAKKMKSALAAQTGTDGHKLYPELAWGANPGSINGLRVESNSTVSFNDSDDKAIVGDFQNAFKWGYAKDVSVEVIEYGDPDNSGMDLKGYNQVYLRGEAYVGWAIMDSAAFAIVTGTGIENGGE